jgi:hypothetical protein
VLPHAAWGVLCAVLAGLAASEAFRPRASRALLLRPALLLGAGTGLQVLLGLGAYFANTQGFEERVRPHFQVAATSVHQAAGALVLAASVVLHLRARLLLRDPRGEAGGEPAAAGGPAVAGARP